MSNRNLGLGEGSQPLPLGMQQGGDSLAVVSVDLGHTATLKM